MEDTDVGEIELESFDFGIAVDGEEFGEEEAGAKGGEEADQVGDENVNNALFHRTSLKIRDFSMGKKRCFKRR